MFSSLSKIRRHATNDTTSRKGRRSGDRRRAAGLGVESLEGRALMAGDVAASVQWGDLVINGDANSNGVQVTQINATTFSVAGIQNGGSTRVNGSLSARVFANVTGNVRVNLNGGSDLLRIGGSGEASRMVLPGSLTVSGGDGNDSVNVQYLNTGNNSTISIDTGSGMDTVSLDRIFNRSTVAVTTGSQNDTVSVTNSTIFTGLAVGTSDGADRLTVVNNVMDGFRAEMGSGDDTVDVRSNLIWLDAYVNGGDGWDTLTASGNSRTIRRNSIA